jgi:uncharacterized protein
MNDGLSRWRLVFGEVLHTRLRPVRHAFRYRSFFVRLPADELVSRRGNWLFGVNRRALLSMHASDHGDGRAPLDWLRDMLEAAGVTGVTQVWLHAFPRVLGYTFKPVSFWFCHRAGGEPVAIIAEVNNTFGERHAYLLADPAGAPLRSGTTLRAVKAFHVSPFCSVQGEYLFRFVNTDERCLARIDHHDSQGPLLLTSLSGRQAPVRPDTIRHALLGYPFFTLGVIVRIHWHALRLWLRKVPFHRKPEPPGPMFTRGNP